MFGKRKKTEAEKAEQKKKKFLTEKFKMTTKGVPIIGGIGAAAFAPLAFVDGGLSFLMTTALLGIITPAALFGDAKSQEDVLFTTDCDQRIFAKGWAKTLQQKIQTDLVKTQLKINFSDKDRKKYKKLVERKEKLIEIAKDLEPYLTVIDDQNRPTNQVVAYITKTITKDKEADRAFYIYPGAAAKSAPAAKPPGQER